jgi:hypothetical protein
MINKKLQAQVDLAHANAKLKWHAKTPDGKIFEWYPAGDYVGGDPFVATQVESIILHQPWRLKLGFYQSLPADVTNPYSVRLALQILYDGMGDIEYFGNVPNFDDVIDKLPPGAVE